MQNQARLKLNSLAEAGTESEDDFEAGVSSLDNIIWNCFCSFLYSWLCFDHKGLSSDVINCIKKKWERKSTLSTAFNAFSL